MLQWYYVSTSGVLGFEPPEALLRAVFVTVGMYFSLRGGQEHYDLKVDQFKQDPAVGYSKETHYRYVENGSKNYQGYFSESNKSNKIVKVFAEPESDKCPVRILDSYLSKLPKNPPAFYLQWLTRVPESSIQPWYKRVRVGINPLKRMMPTISERAKLPVRYTNHSLRATSCYSNVCFWNSRKGCWRSDGT